MRATQVALALVIAGLDRAIAADADTLSAWFEPRAANFTIAVDAEVLREAPLRSSVDDDAYWSTVTIMAPASAPPAGEAVVTIAAEDAQVPLDGGRPTLRLQRVAAGATLRASTDAAVIGVNATPSCSRAALRDGWRVDWSIDAFMTRPIDDRQRLVLLLSYDSARTWIPSALLPSVADLVVVDDTWWALIGVPTWVRWRPLRWLTIEGGFIDDPAASVAATLGKRWSFTIDARWHEEVARTVSGLDAVEELRITAGPAWKPYAGAEIAVGAGVAVDRLAVTGARIGGLGGDRQRLADAWIGGIEISIGF